MLTKTEAMPKFMGDQVIDLGTLKGNHGGGGMFGHHGGEGGGVLLAEDGVDALEVGEAQHAVQQARHEAVV